MPAPFCWITGFECTSAPVEILSLSDHGGAFRCAFELTRFEYTATYSLEFAAWGRHGIKLASKSVEGELWHYAFRWAWSVADLSSKRSPQVLVLAGFLETNGQANLARQLRAAYVVWTGGNMAQGFEGGVVRREFEPVERLTDRSLQVFCAACGRVYNRRESNAGEVFPCSDCGAMVTVPGTFRPQDITGDGGRVKHHGAGRLPEDGEDDGWERLRQP